MPAAAHPAKALLALSLLALAWPAHAQQRIDIAVISDGPDDRLPEYRQMYVDELLALTQNEFDVRLRDFTGAWTEDSIEAAYAAAYADDAVDMVLTTGFIAAQLGTQRKAYPKPTFLPLILDPRLLSRPPVDGKSGIPNLSYLIVYSNIGEDLDSLTELIDVDRVALLVDAELSGAIPQLLESSTALSRQRGIELDAI
ncbi:MAG: hypothetical protein AAGD86_01415, partial [Pseudomonadota bacterium]